MNALRRYLVLLAAIALVNLLTACSKNSSLPSESASLGAGCGGAEDDDAAGEDEDEPGDVDAGGDGGEGCADDD